MNKLGIWGIVIAGAFLIGVVSANPVVEAAGGWKATFDDLSSQITSNDVDIEDHQTRITDLENQPVGTQIYTKTTSITGIGAGVTLAYQDFCDVGDTVITAYLKDIQGAVDQHSIVQSNAIETATQEGYRVRMNTAGVTQDYEGVIVCADTNP